MREDLLVTRSLCKKERRSRGIHSFVFDEGDRMHSVQSFSSEITGITALRHVYSQGLNVNRYFDGSNAEMRQIRTAD